MIKSAAPVTLLALGLLAAPAGADDDHRHRVEIRDHNRGTHVVHLEWDEDEFEAEMERFAERMERFGERMGRLGERIGRDVERAMENVDWDEIERRHRHRGREIHIHGDDVADLVESSVEISMAAAFEALEALDHIEFDVRFDEEAFERDMERLEEELDRLDVRMDRDLDDAMEELEREMERLEEELERLDA